MLPEAWEGGEGRIYTKDREMLLWVESSALQEYHVNGKNRMQGAWLCSSSPNPSASSLPSKNLAFRESAHYFCELVHFVDSKHSKENTSFFVFSKYSLGGTLCFSSFPTPDPLSFFFSFWSAHHCDWISSTYTFWFLKIPFQAGWMKRHIK